jgi:hypothetical protein
MSDWKVSPRNFRAWGGPFTVQTKRSMGPEVTLRPVRNMTIDMRPFGGYLPPKQPWWTLFWEPSKGGWRRK